MSLEALWTMQYRTADGWQLGGVVVLETGRIFGGDADYYYLGDYQVAASGAVSATINVTFYGKGQPGSAFGRPDTKFTVQGLFVRKGDVLDGEFWRPEQAHFKLPAQLTRRADLP
jgi:hypothetical protein